MTRVLAGAAGDRFFLQVCGHATGSVQVCAAVSGLVYALAGYVQNDACVNDNICDIMEADARLSFSGGEQAAGCGALHERDGKVDADVVSGDDEERIGQFIGNAADGNLSLLHCL